MRIYTCREEMKHQRLGEEKEVTTNDAVKSKPAARRGRKALSPNGIVGLPQLLTLAKRVKGGINMKISKWKLLGFLALICTVV